MTAIESLKTSSPIDSVTLNEWYVLARAEEVPPGTLLKRRLLETDLVLWRSQEGEFHVWEDRCPHRSVRLSAGRIAGEHLICAYHGLQFDRQGTCVKVPAHPGYTPPPQACVRTYPVQERYGLVYGSLGNPSQGISLFPEWEDRTYRCYLTGPYFIDCGGLRAIENFLDLAHTPFIHPETLGDPNQAEIPDYEVAIEPQGVNARNIRLWQPNGYGLTGEGQFVEYEYWAFRPLTAYLRKFLPNGDCLTILYNVTPVSEVESIGWMICAMNHGHHLPVEELESFQNRITGEDLVNLAAHHPKKLPLASLMELHLPSDRTSVAYRKWLRQLGVTYGVIY